MLSGIVLFRCAGACSHRRHSVGYSPPVARRSVWWRLQWHRPPPRHHSQSRSRADRAGCALHRRHGRSGSTSCSASSCPRTEHADNGLNYREGTGESSFPLFCGRQSGNCLSVWSAQAHSVTYFVSNSHSRVEKGSAYERKPKLKLVYDPRYNSDLSALGIKVPFALDRGQRVLDELAAKNGAPVQHCRPKPLTKSDLLLVHSEQYLKSLKLPATWQATFGLVKAPADNDETRKAIRKLLSEIRLKSGGTLHAARAALKGGLAANLGAGYHHAFADHGEGYCSINDIAIAIRKLRAEGLCRKVMIVDVDLHQGNGNAAIFPRRPRCVHVRHSLTGSVSAEEREKLARCSHRARRAAPVSREAGSWFESGARLIYTGPGFLRSGKRPLPERHGRSGSTSCV